MRLSLETTLIYFRGDEELKATGFGTVAEYNYIAAGSSHLTVDRSKEVFDLRATRRVILNAHFLCVR